MSLIGSTKYVERVRFFENERLIAPDLQAMDDHARQMRWLHNRSLHQPGVASGFAVAGEKGDREVTIDSGYALDALGREIVLTQSILQPVPPVAGDGLGGPATFDLTVAYPATLSESETRTADCASATPGAVRLQESPVFCWVPAFRNDALRKQIESGIRIVLARVEVLNCQLNRAISVAHRSDARPGVHPFIYAGTANPGWVVKSGTFGIGLAPEAGAPPQPVPVDTSAAGFRTVPGYFVSLADETTILLGTNKLRLEVFISVSDPKTTGFQVSLLIPNLILLAAGISVEAVLSALKPAPTWRIEWMGVEA